MLVLGHDALTVWMTDDAHDLRLSAGANLSIQALNEIETATP